jgi:type IV pilus assembly protein PilC
MVTFRYQVRDPLGRFHDGTIEAASPDVATQLLRRDGFQVLMLEEARSEGSLFPRPISRRDILYMTSQLAVMVDTGITLSAAFEGIAEQEENPSLKKLMLDLKSRVEAGDDFSKALAEHPKYFDRTYVTLIKASEQTGSLGEMLENIATYSQKELEMRGKVRAAMAYPAVMIVVATGVTIFLLTYILPKFQPLFERKNVQLPTPTVLAMAASDALMQYWYLWLLGTVALVVGVWFGRRTRQGQQLLDWLYINAPLVGPTVRKVILSRNIRTLGAMIASGVSVLDALRLSAEVSANHYYETLWLGVLDAVTTGNRICESLRHTKLVPSTLVQMIGAGEESGRLDDVLKKVSVHYDREVETSIKTVTSMIEPLMITIMGFVVGGIGLALLLPIFSLSRAG